MGVGTAQGEAYRGLKLQRSQLKMFLEFDIGKCSYTGLFRMVLPLEYLSASMCHVMPTMPPVPPGLTSRPSLLEQLRGRRCYVECALGYTLDDASTLILLHLEELGGGSPLG